MNAMMLQPESVLQFGKYKGRRIEDLFSTDPSYLSWMLQTGYANFGKRVTEMIVDWQESNPKEVLRIQKSIDKKKAEERSVIERSESVPVHNPEPAPVVKPGVSAAWGSW